MRHPLFDIVEKKYKRTGDLAFDIGDTVVVTLRIVEGDKERLQDFEGTLIARRGYGLDEMFTVRRLVGDEGVERTFPLHSPKIAAIKIKRSGKVRRSKLYYLRARVGKARKLRERRVSADARKEAVEAAAARARALGEVEKVVEPGKRGRGSREKAMAAT
jgi:large subunit ribosomal protein L19